MTESNVVDFPGKKPSLSLRERLRPESKNLGISIDNDPFDPSYIFFLGAAKQNLVQLKTLENRKVQPVVKKENAKYLQELYRIAFGTDFFKLLNFVKHGDMTNLVKFLKRYTSRNVNEEEEITKSLNVSRILLTTYENWDGVVRANDEENPYDEFTARKMKKKIEHTVKKARSQEVLPYAPNEILTRSEAFFNSVRVIHKRRTEESAQNYPKSRTPNVKY